MPKDAITSFDEDSKAKTMDEWIADLENKVLTMYCSITSPPEKDLVVDSKERVKNTYSRNDSTTFAKSYWWLILCKFPDKKLALLLFTSGEGNNGISHKH